MDKRVWTVRDVLDWTVRFLTEKGLPSPRQDVEYMLSYVLRTTRMNLYMQLDRPMSRAELSLFKSLVKRRLKREPLQYITGVAYLWKYEFLVERGVFIPRRETETLIEVVLGNLRGREAFIVDVGVGTGCVLLSVLKDNPMLRGVGVDISPKALEVFYKNRARLELSRRAWGVRGDCLSPFGYGVFDAVVSNPPYVKTSEIDKLQDEISKYEPRQAIDGGSDGLFFIRRLVREAYDRLKVGGFLALEVGEGQAQGVRYLMKGAGFSKTEVSRDLSGIERVVVGWKL